MLYLTSKILIFSISIDKFISLGETYISFTSIFPYLTQALSVGIFPYVLKLLQSSARELRPLLVFIWAKILSVDSVSFKISKSWQLDFKCIFNFCFESVFCDTKLTLSSYFISYTRTWINCVYLFVYFSSVLSDRPGERQRSQVLPVRVSWSLHACKISLSVF